MKNKKVVIISHVIYPTKNARAHRTMELVRELGVRGYDVTLFAALGKADYKDLEKEFRCKIRDLGSFFWHVIDSDGGPYKKSLFVKSVRLFLRPFFDLRELELLFKTSKVFKNDNYDCVISIAPSHAVNWGCAFAKTFNSLNFPKKWIADCGDPYMKNPFHKYPPPFYFKYVEKWFCRLVDNIVVPMEKSKGGYYKEFTHKIKVIPQGVDFDQFVTKGYLKNEVPTFIYAGSIYPGKRDLNLFLSYLLNVDLPFKFIVYTNQKEAFSEFSILLNDKLELRDYVEREELIFSMSQADFLVNLTNIGTVQIPSKLIDYGLAGRPILNIGSESLEENIITSFLNGCYDGEYIVENLDDFRIQSVVDKFEKIM